MTVGDLHNKLQRLGISEDKYYLHGLFGSTDDNSKLGLVIKAGKYTAEYEVYYRERGEKHSIRLFNNENEACHYFLQQIQEN